MERLKVLVTDYVFETFDTERRILATANVDLVVLQCKSAAELIPQVADADGLLNTYLPGIDDAVFAAAPRLRAVVRYGIGVDTIDLAAATRRGIMVANVPDYCIDEVADHALAHFLSLNRKLSISDRKVKAGQWSLAYVKPLKALRGMRVGILGFGRIGRAIAARLQPFGCEVVFHDPALPADSAGGKALDLDTLLASADAIIVQCPSTPATRGLLGREAFAKMRRQPLLINCARGEVVDTDALVEALRSGAVSGAGLDVLQDEAAVLKQPHPLREFDNVILTPHSAWVSTAAIPNLQRRAAEEMAIALKGQRPSSLLNPEVWRENAVRATP
jgi:D-3-phosphoglycerate dehydrogenase